ncbi:hypothetical protein ACV3PA_06570 [Exiguobacterium acetylicum]|uniref:hypothetical protein n=1 Tax=Exiguobacterium TaxID=33986 RepID=UPI0006AA32F7|nr:MULTISPECIES: hypothetical protein [Exiguobacterium]KOP30000.1 membrane protein [Exiguobacterium sp. BMC-KP]MCY1690309.1 hypothetical protein [Exiguobacterium sp. SL14]UKS55364.1 hypothetical protein K6T22_12555 [Exiguobacterium acetylicum]
MADQPIKHPFERFVGFVGMTSCLRYGYSFIDSERSLPEIFLYLVVGFALIILLEALGKRLARKLPVVRMRYLTPLYLIYLYVFFTSFYSSSFGFAL